MADLGQDQISPCGDHPKHITVGHQGNYALGVMMHKVKELWHTALAVPGVRRILALALGLLLGLALEQVARLGVLPPEVVQGLRHVLSALN